ncbi:hypothetical protein PCASD_18237 [Puccinia coronata f. sp. avenae]|uniref:CxC1-like cysteine cluster associated with KDZ transposases domain-containing protein n=1 Tax=Puccinia coronata f. sp. avenae TaxID=200324 RepID=A0A2N5SIS4_9BASI|nr:hypothetical protein PCASD_18237 [Puccinia coronata f. sp. avenae]
MFRLLEEKSERMVESVLQLDNQEVLAGRTCPACFGPQPANHNDYEAATRDRLIICLDGNFQHRHHSKASRDYEILRTPHIFLPEGAADSMTREICHMEILKKPPEKADRCANAHKAADNKRNESTWKGCDDTGLMGAFCRHDAAMSLVNIFKSGEKRALPLALLKKLLLGVEENRPVGVLYDIGCLLNKYIKARDLRLEYKSQLTFGTSIFHSYVHNWGCQLDYNPRLNTGWGLSDGEGLERMWSYLSSLVSPLRYATRNHRLESIAHCLKYHNKRSIKQLSSAFWLIRKFKNATKRQRETQSQLEAILKLPNPFGKPGDNYTISFLKKQWTHQRSFRADHTDEEHERRKQLIKLYEHRSTLEVLKARLLDPKFHLLSKKEVNKIFDNVKKVSNELQKLEKELSDELLSDDVDNDE